MDVMATNLRVALYGGIAGAITVPAYLLLDISPGVVAVTSVLLGAWIGRRVAREDRWARWYA
jgi:hypothetical protein